MMSPTRDSPYFPYSPEMGFSAAIASVFGLSKGIEFSGPEHDANSQGTDASELRSGKRNGLTIK